jgi:hypothetical protein
VIRSKVHSLNHRRDNDGAHQDKDTTETGKDGAARQKTRRESFSEECRIEDGFAKSSGRSTLENRLKTAGDHGGEEAQGPEDTRLNQASCKDGRDFETIAQPRSVARAGEGFSSRKTN